MLKRGQSIVEFSLIAILVILGIIFMGPYVLRSVSAHYKLWDEGVQDSFSENINQASINDLPAITSNCLCTDTPTGSCGFSSSSGLGSCAANSEIISHTCPPPSVQGCDGAPASSCLYNPLLCCSTYYPQGCGMTPIPAQYIDTTNDAQNIPSGLLPPAGSPSPCFYGQQISSTMCSSLPVECNTNSTCNPQCLGQSPTGATACPNATTNLDQNYGTVPVATDNQTDCLNIPGCTFALCAGPGGTPPQGIGSPDCTYCNPAAKCQFYDYIPVFPIQCFYNGSSFSGTYDGDFESNCADFTSQPSGPCSSRNGGTGAVAVQYLTFFCTNNYLTGVCDYATPHYQNSGSDRGINMGTSSMGCINGPSANNILCSGNVNQTYYWQNSQGISSYYDAVTSCPGWNFQGPNTQQCGSWGAGCAAPPVGSNDSFTITCDSSGNLQSLTVNNASPSYTPAQVHGCNWNGTQTLYDFGGGNDMTWTCQVTNGYGVLTQVAFTPINTSSCNSPESPND